MARRGLLMVAGAAVVALAGLLTLLVPGGATGAEARHCARLSQQSLARERIVTGTGRAITVVGDSYSVGLGLRDPAASWPSRLPGRVRVLGFSGSGFSAHASPCGARVSYAVRAARAVAAGTGLVVVEGGLNDYDQPDQAVRVGFRALVRALRGHDLVVVGPAEAPSRAAGARHVDAILRQESARAGVRYLSMLDVPVTYLADRLHPTPAGHAAYGRAVAAALN